MVILPVKNEEKVVDAVFQNLEIAKSKIDGLKSPGLESGKYIVATVHRQENVDDEARFLGIINGLRRVHEAFGVPLIYPVHSRAKKQIREFSLKSNGLSLAAPLDYLAFLLLESGAKIVITDSGGVQEETCVLRVPCVTLRDNTERPETLEVGSNILAGTDPERIVDWVSYAWQ